MIVSHRHRFIFLKTNKTAGTSVEIALSRICGPDDIITSITPADELLRREHGGRGPQHHLAPPWQYGFSDVVNLLRRRRLKRRFYNHMPAREVMQHVEHAVWSGYFKFCIERNPWDRVISLYHHLHRDEPRPTLRDFLASPEPARLKKFGSGVYTVDGQVVVNKICRFENLDADLEDVRRHLELPEPLALPHAKGGYRKDKTSYHDQLDPAARDRIAELFKDEIERLGYTF